MYEIELKAHVENRAQLIKTVERFADFAGAVEKEDTYYSKTVEGKEIRVRIRKEIPFTTQEIENAPAIAAPKSVIFTYKRKEIRTEGNNAFEVNDEKECLLSDALPFEAFLTDTGFNPVLTKHKIVLDWQYDGVLLELCSVDRLGDFIELEIMSESNDDKIVTQTKQKLLKILSKCGISEDKIEERYYSQMLEELSK